MDRFAGLFKYWIVFLAEFEIQLLLLFYLKSIIFSNGAKSLILHIPSLSRPGSAFLRIYLSICTTRKNPRAFSRKPAADSAPPLQHENTSVQKALHSSVNTSKVPTLTILDLATSSCSTSAGPHLRTRPTRTVRSNGPFIAVNGLGAIFDIVTLAVHKRTVKRNEWRDISLEIKKEIEMIWNTEFGDNWRELVTKRDLAP